MNNYSLLAALIIKSRLGLDAKLENGRLSTSVGYFDCGVSAEQTLSISGPGLFEEISGDRVASLVSLIEYLIEHGDGIVISPRNIRESRVENIAESYDVDPIFVKTAISEAHRIVRK